MKTFRVRIIKWASYFFILLFCYAAISKALDFENFQVQIGQSPLLSAYAFYISYAVIITELMIVFLLAWVRTRLLGLYASTAIMSAFTVYIYLILHYSDFVPCSCGGILEKLGWTEHLIFNLIGVLLGMTAVAAGSKAQRYSTKRMMITLIASNVLSCLFIIALFFSSEYIIKKDNNFTRRFLIHPVIQDKIYDLKVNSFYFSGMDDQKIYLGNYTAPLVLSDIEFDLTAFKQNKIKLSDKDYPFRNLQVRILNKNFYLYDGTVPVIYRGSLNDFRGRLISRGDAYFNQLVPLDTARFALRTQNRVTRYYTLADLDLHRIPKIKLSEGILQKQIDGVFDSDGFLVKKQNSKELIYAYSYRNEFMLMDDRVHLKDRFRTIDTVTTAQVKVTVLSDGRRKMSAPPVKINKACTSNSNLVFISSASKARNESAESGQGVSVVDMYFTDKHEYAGSFYIKNRNGNKISKMTANDHYLFIIMGNELIRYRFTKPVKDLYRSGEAENLNKE